MLTAATPQQRPYPPTSSKAGIKKQLSEKKLK